MYKLLEETDEHLNNNKNYLKKVLSVTHIHDSKNMISFTKLLVGDLQERLH